jgi:hypothetical protein
VTRQVFPPVQTLPAHLFPPPQPKKKSTATALATSEMRQDRMSGA